MIAKFHSAPGHSMETTLTISLPPPQSVRAARGEQPRERQKEKEKEKKGREEEKEREKEHERAREREKEHKELERERVTKSHSERTVSYKDKFQRMRERYDKVTSSHDTQQRDLDALNAKIKKLQAENDLLLDAMYLAVTPLYERYFPGPPELASPTLDSAATHFPPSHQSQGSPVQQRFSEYYPHAPPQHSSAHYSSTMPPPGSMLPPPRSTSSSTSITPGSAISPMLPPNSLMPSPSMAMPPPSSSINGSVTGNGNMGRTSSSRRLSNASSARSRRRSDPRASALSSAGVPLGPDDNISGGSGDRTPHRTPTPSVGAPMDVEDLPLRSPRVNGSIGMRDRATISSGNTPTGLTNGMSPRGVGRRQPEIPYPMPTRDGDSSAPEPYAHEPPVTNDDPAYNMNAYAAVNSPDEPDEDDQPMHVDG